MNIPGLYLCCYGIKLAGKKKKAVGNSTEHALMQLKEGTSFSVETSHSLPLLLFA